MNSRGTRRRSHVVLIYAELQAGRQAGKRTGEPGWERFKVEVVILYRVLGWLHYEEGAFSLWEAPDLYVNSGQTRSVDWGMRIDAFGG